MYKRELLSESRRPCLTVNPAAAHGELMDVMQQPQTLFFKDATGKAFTMVRAGLAFTVHIFPKISFLQALVAGFARVLIRQRPGKVKMPFFWTSLAAMAAMLPIILPAMLALSSHSSAMAAAMPLLVRGLPATRAPFMGLAAAFIAFMGAMLVTGCEVHGKGREAGKNSPGRKM